MIPRTLTQEELLAEARERFGPDPLDFAFQCPACGDIATIRDFQEAGDGARAGQECIGRLLGAIARTPAGERAAHEGRGCNWAAYGLFPGPWAITMPGGKTVRSFPLAERTEVA